MAEAAEGEAEERISARTQRYPRDLLRQFSGESNPLAPAPAEEDSGEIELSLGLSLGGSFGADPAHKRWLLHRSSSSASIPFLARAEERGPAAATLLKRTCSLPTETEEEQTKRKELQCLRWMGAKRKRTERMNGHVRGEDARQEGDGGPGWERKSESEQLRGWAKSAPFGAVAGPPNRVAASGAARATWRGAEGMVRCFAPVPQGSLGSQGSSSPGLSEFDSRPRKQQAFANGIQSRSSSGIQSPPDLTDHHAPRGPVSSTGKGAAAGGGNGAMRDMMEEMPCVSTRGGGGRRVEGFLYRYRKGEEVRIVCVCHGRFLSPAEFVKHAGGGDVAHPLRHIIVNPSPSGFFF